MTIVHSYIDEWVHENVPLKTSSEISNDKGHVVTYQIGIKDRMPLTLSSTGIQIVSMVTMLKEFISYATKPDRDRFERVFQKYIKVKKLIITDSESMKDKLYVQKCLKIIIDNRSETILIHRDKHVVDAFLKLRDEVKDRLKSH
ncbi:MAG: hypothetical protein OHK0056_31220 [Bacteriovoracaceae bacterium]